MAATYTWIGGGDQNWFTNANWSPAPPSTQKGPMDGDTAVFNQFATGSINGTDQRVYAAPAAPTLSATPTSGGTITAGTYWVIISYTNANGETVGSPAASQAIAGANELTITSPTLLGAATGWYAYVGGPSVSQPANASMFRQQAPGSPTAIGTNLVITTNPTSSGTNPLTTSTATYTVAAVNVYQTFAGTLTIGTQANPLRVNATNWTLGIASGNSSATGSGRINIDAGTLSAAIDILATSQTPIDTGLETARINCNNGSLVVNVSGQSIVGFGTDTVSDTPNLGTINVGSGSVVNLGAGCTVSNLINDGGTVVTWSAPNTIQNVTGTLTTFGSTLIPTIEVDGGTVVLNHRKTGGVNAVTGLQLYGGTVDFSQDGRTFKAGTIYIRNGSLIYFNAAQLTFTATTWDFTYASQKSIS